MSGAGFQGDDAINESGAKQLSKLQFRAILVVVLQHDPVTVAAVAVRRFQMRDHWSVSDWISLELTVTARSLSLFPPLSKKPKSA